MAQRLRNVSSCGSVTSARVQAVVFSNYFSDQEMAPGLLRREIGNFAVFSHSCSMGRSHYFILEAILTLSNEWGH